MWRTTVREDTADRTDRSNLKHLTDQERWALYAPWLEHENPAVRANATICLCVSARRQVLRWETKTPSSQSEAI